MKKIFEFKIRNYSIKLLLGLSILFLPFPLYSQYTLTDESGNIQIIQDEYVNYMNMSWDINTGTDKYLILNFSSGISEYSCDYIYIYEVDENGYKNLIQTVTGYAEGEIKTTIRTGRARVEFVTDYEDSYIDNYSLWGFSIWYNVDNTVYASNNLEVKYNTKINGNLEIGTHTSYANSQLLVKGKIKARNVEMTTSGWADFVFDSNYKLPALTDVDEYIGKHKHLPGLPSAIEVKENGVKVSEMQMKLLQKIEELTLYVIQHQKDLDALK